MIDRKKFPKLGEQISQCLEVVGYRLEPGTTATSIGSDVFRCSPSALSKKFTGDLGVASADISVLTKRLTLDVDGIFPEDFDLSPKDLRAKMKKLRVGIYGQAACTQLFRALSGIASPDARIELKKEKTRASALTADPANIRKTHALVLNPGDAIRFICRGPLDKALVLLEHQVDGNEADVLSPVEPGEWARIDNDGSYVLPDRIDRPWYVKRQDANHHVSALWMEPEFAQAFDRELEVPSNSPLADEALPAEFRVLTAVDIARLIDVLEAPKSPVVAASTLTYHVRLG